MPLPAPTRPTAGTGESLRWDLFCRVVDNFGDVGVCWRLATRLAALGQTVRLWIDDDAALAWMAPPAQRPAGIAVLPWRGPAAGEQPGDVVVEAFGCDPPPAFVGAMRQAAVAPVWIDLEYLSAEPYAERSHGLPSPQAAGPGAGLTKWFFFPGFTPHSGGLLLEADWDAHRAAFDPTDWRAGLGLPGADAGLRLSLFCYGQPRLADALAAWRPGEALVTPGLAADAVARTLQLPATPAPGSRLAHGATALQFLPWLPQAGYDALLWSCDLNAVRGEDSLVRALWAGRPFVWQLYPQDDGAHAAKLEAFLAMYLEGAAPALAEAVGRCVRQWNGLAPGPIVPPDMHAWRRFAAARADALRAQQAAHGDLAVRLCRFARRVRAGPVTGSG